MKIKLNDVVVGYNRDFERVAGRVTAVNEAEKTVSVTPFHINTETLHEEDCTVVDVPESKTLHTRLNPHAKEHRERLHAAAKAAANPPKVKPVKAKKVHKKGK